MLRSWFSAFEVGTSKHILSQVRTVLLSFNQPSMFNSYIPCALSATPGSSYFDMNLIDWSPICQDVTHVVRHLSAPCPVVLTVRTYICPIFSSLRWWPIDAVRSSHASSQDSSSRVNFTMTRGTSDMIGWNKSSLGNFGRSGTDMLNDVYLFVSPPVVILMDLFRSTVWYSCSTVHLKNKNMNLFA